MSEMELYLERQLLFPGERLEGLVRVSGDGPTEVTVSLHGEEVYRPYIGFDTIVPILEQTQTLVCREGGAEFVFQIPETAAPSYASDHLRCAYYIKAIRKRAHSLLGISSDSIQRAHITVAASFAPNPFDIRGLFEPSPDAQPSVEAEPQPQPQAAPPEEESPVQLGYDEIPSWLPRFETEVQTLELGNEDLQLEVQLDQLSLEAGDTLTGSFLVTRTNPEGALPKAIIFSLAVVEETTQKTTHRQVLWRQESSVQPTPELAYPLPGTFEFPIPRESPTSGEWKLFRVHYGFRARLDWGEKKDQRESFTIQVSHPIVRQEPARFMTDKSERQRGSV